MNQLAKVQRNKRPVKSGHRPPCLTIKCVVIEHRWEIYFLPHTMKHESQRLERCADCGILRDASGR